MQQPKGDLDYLRRHRRREPTCLWQQWKPANREKMLSKGWGQRTVTVRFNFQCKGAQWRLLEANKNQENVPQTIHPWGSFKGHIWGRRTVKPSMGQWEGWASKRLSHPWADPHRSGQWRHHAGRQSNNTRSQGLKVRRGVLIEYRL